MKAFAFILLSVQVCFAQIEFTEHIIADNFDGAYSVFPIDVDADGDIDVVGAAMYGSGIAWWENDGNQDFTEHIIEREFNQGESVYAADLDGDGDIDVMGAAFGPPFITWWENDGEENFTEHVITEDFVMPTSIFGIDLDGDDDVDILGGGEGGIDWWENDGEANFTEHGIDGFDGARSVYANDIDGDGDMDVYGAGLSADEIAWWENDGNEDFTKHTIVDNFNWARSAYATDIDGDGDVDVLGTAAVDDEIAWWENDGNEDFTKHAIDEDFSNAWTVFAADLNGDGSVDLLNSGGNEVTWWENDGDENFTEHTICDDLESATSAYAFDVDGDSDFDILGAALQTDEVFWLENDLDPGGILRGFVFDFESNRPLEGAVVATSYGFESTTNGDGFWQIGPTRSGAFHLTARMIGYNDSTLFDLEMELDDTLEFVFALLHPELDLSIEEFDETIPKDSSIMLYFTVSNQGNGPLEWSVVRRLIGESGVDPWVLRETYDIGSVLDDNRLQGVVFVDDHFYVTGGGNETNMIYVLDRDANLVRSFRQFGESNYGMKDLAFDGELIWGASEGIIYGFSTEGDSVTSFQAHFSHNSAITWDPDRELLWISGTTTDIHGYDREGNHNRQHELSRQGLRIYGLAFMSGDSLPLYIFNNPGENRQVVHKMNPDSGDTLFVRELSPEGGGSPVGAFITDQFDNFGSWVFMDIANAGAGDRIDIWQLQANIDWMVIEPNEGVVQLGGSQDFALILNSFDLDSNIVMEGELIFSQSVGGPDTHLPVTLRIVSNSVIEDMTTFPSKFGITSAYPNPFNATSEIKFSLPQASWIELTVYDVAGKQVLEVLERRFSAGEHSATFNANSLGSGVYIVRLGAIEAVSICKVTLIK